MQKTKAWLLVISQCDDCDLPGIADVNIISDDAML
jgi:hypothetical protein